MELQNYYFFSKKARSTDAFIAVRESARVGGHPRQAPRSGAVIGEISKRSTATRRLPGGGISFIRALSHTAINAQALRAFAGDSSLHFVAFGMTGGIRLAMTRK